LNDPLTPSAAELERAEVVAAGRAERAQQLREHLLKREERARRAAEAEDFMAVYRRSLRSA
jgi:hypothetical protein